MPQKAKILTEEEAASRRAKRAAYQRAWVARNPERKKELDQASHIRHKETRNKSKSLRYSKEEIRFMNFKSKHGITRQQYEDLLERQDYKCSICQTRFYHIKHTHIDHCHEGGQIRGILCHHCNTGIGLFRDNPNLLFEAAVYLTHPITAR